MRGPPEAASPPANLIWAFLAQYNPAVFWAHPASRPYTGLQRDCAHPFEPG